MRAACCADCCSPTSTSVRIEWEAGLKELRCSPFAMTAPRMDLYLDMIDRRGIAYLHGYPSAIEILCRHMWRTGRRPRAAIRGVFPISEPLYGYQRDIIRAVLPEAAIAPFYGLSERVLFAAELPGVDGEYAFEPLYGHAELLDESGCTRYARRDERPFRRDGFPLHRHAVSPL